MKYQDKKFKSLVDSGVIRNYILLVAAERLGIAPKIKERLYCYGRSYASVIVTKAGLAGIETGLVEVELEGRKIAILFNILPLGKDEVVLGMLFLKEFNLKIDWVTR